MFGIGQPELLVILLIVLLLFGPSSLPKLSKTVGESAGAFRDGFTDGKNDISVKDIAQDVTSSARDIKYSLLAGKSSSNENNGYGESGYGQKESV